jgi:protoporphyrinogen oxidase
MKQSPIIIGAGPAGLTAAYELVKGGAAPVVFEKSGKVGGLARTEAYKGYRFDVGGHRFYTQVPEIQALWEEVLGDEFIKVPRLSRIHYNGRFFNYPLSLSNVIRNLGVTESLLILGSYCKACLRSPRMEETFEDWVTTRFGRRLYRAFFKTYTEKVWGIPCSVIRADWAAQRIRGLSLVGAVTNALFGARNAKSLINEFHYPRLGPGQMWEAFRQRVEARGGQVHLDTGIRAIHRQGFHIRALTVEEGGRTREVPAEQVISSMPISRLMACLRPRAPSEMLEAAAALKYRDFVIVTLIVNQPDLFPDNWIYIHTPQVRVGRIQNFKNWSRALVPDPSKTSLGMEYFCSRGDDLWALSDAELIRLATRELDQLKLARAADVEDGHVIRQPQAYPVYDADYRRHLQVIRDYLARFDNLQTVGRNGMHRYNNQDHSMVCGLLAARNLLGGRHDLWDVNTERSYYEEQRLSQRAGREIPPCRPPSPDRDRGAEKSTDEAAAAECRRHDPVGVSGRL